MFDVYPTCISVFCANENSMVRSFKKKTLFSFFITCVLSPGIGWGGIFLAPEFTNLH